MCALGIGALEKARSKKDDFNSLITIVQARTKKLIKLNKSVTIDTTV